MGGKQHESLSEGARPALLALGLLALFSAASALAAGVVQSIKGDVRAGPIGKPVTAVTLDQRLPSGTAVVTGPDAQVILRFDDGQQVVLGQRTHFRIADFRYEEADPRSDRSVFGLLKGALRMVSGAIATRNRQAVALRTPQATIGIRGTDFMVALVNPAYISVLEGAVTATNAAGTVVFGAGSIGLVPTSAALAGAIPASTLPAAAAAAFSDLSAAGVVGAAGTAGGASVGAGEATGAAAGVSTGTAVGIGAAAAAAAAAASRSGGSSTTTHH
jgi:FecR-like protein